MLPVRVSFAAAAAAAAAATTISATVATSTVTPSSFVLGMPKVATLQYVVTTVEFTRRDSEEKKKLPTGGSGQNDEAGAVNRSASVPHIASASAEAAGEALQIFAVPLRFSRPCLKSEFTMLVKVSGDNSVVLSLMLMPTLKMGIVVVVVTSNAGAGAGSGFCC